MDFTVGNWQASFGAAHVASSRGWTFRARLYRGVVHVLARPPGPVRRWARFHATFETQAPGVFGRPLMRRAVYAGPLFVLDAYGLRVAVRAPHFGWACGWTDADARRTLGLSVDGPGFGRAYCPTKYIWATWQEAPMAAGESSATRRVLGPLHNATGKVLRGDLRQRASAARVIVPQLIWQPSLAPGIARRLHGEARAERARARRERGAAWDAARTGYGVG